MLNPAFLGYPDVFSFLHDWLPIIFMGLLVLAVFALIRVMPRTRPEQIRPDSIPPIRSERPVWDANHPDHTTHDHGLRPAEPAEVSV